MLRPISTRRRSATSTRTRVLLDGRITHRALSHLGPFNKTMRGHARRCERKFIAGKKRKA